MPECHVIYGWIKSGLDGDTVFLPEYFDSGILLRSTSSIHAVVGNFEGEWVHPVSEVLTPILGVQFLELTNNA